MNKVGYYFLNLLIGLIIVQTLSTLSTIMVLSGLVLLIIHSLIIYYVFNDQFLYLIYLFSLCIMNTSDKMGGIVLAPTVIFISCIFSPGRFEVKDKFIKSSIFILLMTTYLGYIIKNKADMMDIMQSFIIFTGCLLTFVYIQNFKFTINHINLIFKTFTFCSILLFFVALNQKFVFIDTSIPLLGSESWDSTVSEVGIYYGNRMPSLLFDYELFQELSLLFFILAFTIMADKKSMAFFRFKAGPAILVLISFLNMILTGTRSGFLLLFGFLLIFVWLRIKNFFSSQVWILILFLAILIPIVVNYGEVFGLDYLINRFKEIDLRNVGLRNIISGEEMNRAYVYAEGYKRLAEENWLLGFGYGTGQSNNLAWFSNLGATGMIEIRDFHSLYICMPMIYGWIGGVTYLFIIIYLIILLFQKFLKFSDSPLGSLILGLALLFFFFLLNEIKINSLRIYNYHFMIWILMGFGFSISRIKSISDEGSLVY